MALTIGLMSGTSLDGLDAVLVDFGPPLAVRAHRHQPFAPALREELLALNTPGANELHRAALAANALARQCAGLVGALLEEAGVAVDSVAAVGAHGQTVRHQPEAFDGTGYTLQLLNGALLAELCGIDVVCDFRSRDVAAGGQGAPLVPAFHAATFARPGIATAVLNLGGIANLTLLGADGRVCGFDCGPASALLDHWCAKHLGQAYDDGGGWAASGRVDAGLLAGLLAEPYFQQPPPKSTGRDLFNPAWLEARLDGVSPLAPQDVQATLAALTVRSVVEALQRHAPATRELLVCGGGAHNRHLMQGLASSLPGVAVQTTEAFGLGATQVEPVAFAWLARRFLRREPGNEEAVTGARGPRVLGALYPAGR